MARQFEVRWHAASQAWRSDAGDLYTDKKGRQRRKTLTLRYPDGEKIPKSDKPAAMKALAARLEAIKPHSGGYTCGQLADLFLYAFEQKVKADLAVPKTYKEYVKLLSIAVAKFGPGTPADQIKAKDLEAIVEDWKKIGKGATYINALITAVGSCFSWAARPIGDRGKDSAGRDLPEQLIPATPFVRFPRPPIPRGKRKYADRAEIARFLRWAWNHFHPERTRGPFTIGPDTGLLHGPPRKNNPQRVWNRHLLLMIRMIIWTGCRPSEACRARWEWLDWENGILTIPPNRWKNGRKTGKERRIFLTPALMRALRRIHESPVRHPDHLFAHRRAIHKTDQGSPEQGEPWSSDTLSIRVQRLRNLAVEQGVRIRRDGDNRWHLYRLRHTRASDGLMRGFSEAEVADALGTSGDQIKKTYGHFLDEHTAQTALGMAGKPRSPRQP